MMISFDRQDCDWYLESYNEGNNNDSNATVGFGDCIRFIHIELNATLVMELDENNIPVLKFE